MTLIGLTHEKISRVSAFAIATTLWIVLAPLTSGLFTTLPLPEIGWAFLLPGIFTMVGFIDGIFELYRESQMEPFEREIILEESTG